MGSARKNTKSSGLSGNPGTGGARFVLCVRNRDYPASLELRKVYRLLRDEQASKRNQMRVIDESGEDYLYPEDYFVPIKLPQAAEGVLMSGKLFVERRSEEGDYAIRRPRADRISGHESTQAEAIERAREIDPNAAVLVGRVRNTERGHPDKWRKP